MFLNSRSVFVQIVCRYFNYFYFKLFNILFLPSGTLIHLLMRIILEWATDKPIFLILDFRPIFVQMFVKYFIYLYYLIFLNYLSFFTLYETDWLVFLIFTVWSRQNCVFKSVCFKLSYYNIMAPSWLLLNCPVFFHARYTKQFRFLIVRNHACGKYWGFSCLITTWS